MEKASVYGRPVSLDEDLYILDYETGVGNYLAIIEKLFKDEQHQQHKYYLYIELNAKIIPEGSGYPELLLDNRYSKVSNNNHQYSYAKYKNGNLVLSSGNIKFPLRIPQWAQKLNKKENVVSTAQNNFVYKPNEELCIIVSSVDYGFIGKLTGLSYLFGILSLLYFVFNIYQTGVKQTLKNWKNFRTRIQILVAGTIAIATIIFGMATIYYQQRQYDQQNDKIIREKLRSILTEIEQKIGDKDVLTNADEELLSYYLIKFSNVFFTDLNLFNTDGELLASSRKNIFEMGLSSTKINTFAFNQLSRLQNAQFIHREKIGMLSFFSAYALIKNDQGKTLGYLNIPYFARQDEIEKEISFFVGALINVYVVLFLLSVFVAIIISRLIAEPLQLIRSRLGDVALGKPNTPIEWKSKDEIGLLINEYNRMIHQLEESAEKLARSERESAWREMARQVAHEIKNPLTPMKLSVQHLQRTWKENPQEFEQRLKKFTQNLIEQIDTLSNIANEFSDFAKMPRPKMQELDILQIAQQSIEFFKPTTQSHLILHKKTENTHVMADKDQMIRVFNNLLKNAIQAIEEDEDGLIEVLISKQNERILITVRDNGNGINDELKDKIFSPNFTTKTSG
ncbi:MAG: ATP-binding protein, partial [Bacteroidia bacterium]